jgi:hypothetical protein
MKWMVCVLLFPCYLWTDEAKPAPPAPVARSYMAIDSKARAKDYLQVYDLLRKEKSANKLLFHLQNGSTVTNIIDITLLDEGTLLLFRCNTPQGILFQVVEVENIVGVAHL